MRRKKAARSAGKEPVIERRSGVANVEQTGGRRSKPNAGNLIVHDRMMIDGEGGLLRYEARMELFFAARRPPQAFMKNAASLANSGLRGLRRDQRNHRVIATGSHNAPDSGDRHAGDFPWNAGIGGSGEKQLVVFSAVEGLLQRCAGMNGQQRRIDFSCHSGFRANVREVG